MHNAVLQLSLAAQQLVVGAQLARFQFIDALLGGAVLLLDLLLDLFIEIVFQQDLNNKVGNK